MLLFFRKSYVALFYCRTDQQHYIWPSLKGIRKTQRKLYIQWSRCCLKWAPTSMPLKGYALLPCDLMLCHIMSTENVLLYKLVADILSSTDGWLTYRFPYPEIKTSLWSNSMIIIIALELISQWSSTFDCAGLGWVHASNGSRCREPLRHRGAAH